MNKKNIYFDSIPDMHENAIENIFKNANSSEVVKRLTGIGLNSIEIRFMTRVIPMITTGMGYRKFVAIEKKHEKLADTANHIAYKCIAISIRDKIKILGEQGHIRLYDPEKSRTIAWKNIGRSVGCFTSMGLMTSQPVIATSILSLIGGGSLGVAIRETLKISNLYPKNRFIHIKEAKKQLNYIAKENNIDLLPILKTLSENNKTIKEVNIVSIYSKNKI